MYDLSIDEDISLSFCQLFRQFLENHSCLSSYCVIIGLFQVSGQGQWSRRYE
jgi:hypothetical protein